MNRTKDLNKCIIVLTSSNHSTLLYKILKDKRFKVTLTSTPCTLAAGCSRSIKVDKKDVEEIMEIIKDKKIIIKGIYEKVFKGKALFYKKIG